MLGNPKGTCKAVYFKATVNDKMEGLDWLCEGGAIPTTNYAILEAFSALNHMSKLLQSPDVSMETFRRKTEGVRKYLEN